MSSTADLKFLYHLTQVRPQELQIESGTEVLSFLVPLRFRSSFESALQ
jgi:hypothetical protein